MHNVQPIKKPSLPLVVATASQIAELNAKSRKRGIMGNDFRQQNGSRPQVQMVKRHERWNRKAKMEAMDY